MSFLMLSFMFLGMLNADLPWLLISFWSKLNMFLNFFDELLWFIPNHMLSGVFWTDPALFANGSKKNVWPGLLSIRRIIEVERRRHPRVFEQVFRTVRTRHFEHVVATKALVRRVCANKRVRRSDVIETKHIFVRSSLVYFRRLASREYKRKVKYLQVYQTERIPFYRLSSLIAETHSESPNWRQSCFEAYCSAGWQGLSSTLINSK